MKEWKVPAVAIAVVQDGKVIHAKATAIATSKTDFPSPPRRFFPSARSPNRSRLSPSPFSRTKEEWNRDKPVRSYLPEFQMNDPVASEQATPRDLFSHRTGLPRHDLVWYSSDFSREDLVGRLRELKPNKGFRSAYQYNNLPIMTMGYVEGKLTGLG